MQIYKWLVSIGISVVATASLAETDIYQDCEAAVAAGNSALVAELATAMKRYNSIPANRKDKAEACVSADAGEEYVFDTRMGQFRQLESLSEERDQARTEYLENEEAYQNERLDRQAREAAAQRLAERNESLIVADIHSSCLELYKTDRVAAMTNAICIDSFLQGGHPNLGE